MVLILIKRFSTCLLFLGILFWTIPGFSQDMCKLKKKEFKNIRSCFNDSAEPELFRIPEKAREVLNYLNPENCVYTIQDSSAILGYLLQTRAKGRYDYFDYGIIYAPDLSIIRVYVSVYRSTHGAGISQKKWLNQFKGYQGGSLELGSDIDAVSGGTISSESLVNDIKRCHSLMSAILPKQ